MSRQANPKVIGGFVIGALALIVLVIVVFSSGRFLSERPKYMLHFSGSVGGLNVGAPVKLRGVNVGMVVSVQAEFDFKDKKVRIPVVIELTPGTVQAVGGKMGGGKVIDTLVDRGLRGYLATQSMLTGQLYVQFDFFPDAPEEHVKEGGEYPEIPTVPSRLEQLTKEIEKLPIQDMIQKAIDVMNGLERLVNSEQIKGLLASLNATVEEARKMTANINSKVDPLASSLQETFNETNKLVRNTNERIEKLGAGVDATVEETRKLLIDINGEVKSVSTKLNQALGDAQTLVKHVDGSVQPIAKNIEITLKSANSALTQARSTLARVESATNEDSPLRYEILQTLQSLSAAADSIKNFAGYLERHPEALIRGKGEYGGK